MSLTILIVSDVYPPLIGGVELQMQLLARRLQQAGHQVAVATAWQPGLPLWQDDAGVHVYRLKGLSSRVSWFSTNPKRRHHPPLPDPATVWALRRLINRLQPDVIHAYGWIIYSCAVALLGKRIPLLLSVREYGYTCALRTMMHYGRQPCDGPAPAKCGRCAVSYYGRAKGLAAVAGLSSGRFLLRHKVSGVHSVSAYVQRLIRRDLFAGQEQICGAGGNPIPDEVIPSFNVFMEDETAAEDATMQPYLDQLPAEPYILFVGALRLIKGLRPLLEAYRQLHAPPPLVLLGRVASDTPPAFPGNVTVLYDFPHRAVKIAWQCSLFGVAPSIWPEPFGSVIHEAMSQGKAVIGTTPGGQTDMITDELTGLLVPPDDVPALAKAMQRLIEDSQLRQRLGLAARERATAFTAGVIVPRFEQLYYQLVNQSRRHASNSNALPLG